MHVFLAIKKIAMYYLIRYWLIYDLNKNKAVPSKSLKTRIRREQFMEYINRECKRTIYSKSVQVDPNLAIFDEFKDKILNYLFLSDDSEWESPITSPDEVGTRTQEGIISHQYMVKLPGYPAIGYTIYREKNDKLFTFWDMLGVVKQYLNDAGYKQEYSAAEIKGYAKKLGKSIGYVKKNLFPTRIPPILVAGYFGGVDVSAYADWYKYIDNGDKKNNANVVSLYQHAFFTRPFVTEIVSPDRHKKVPVTLQYRDMMALGPQGGLKKLGEMVNQPKVDTTVWDKEDGKPAGFYKSHMRDLLKYRPQDYYFYAMNDAEITLKYLGFVLRIEKEIYNGGLLKSMYIPTTLTSLSDRLTEHYLEQPFNKKQVKKLSKEIFENNLDGYLRPAFYNQLPPYKYANDWSKLIKEIKNTKRRKVRDKQQVLIKKLGSFLSRSSIKWELDKNNKPIQLLNVNTLMKRINFTELYKLNPSLSPYDLFNVDKRIRHFHPVFKVNNGVKLDYDSRAYKFKRNKSNELPTVEEIISFLWEKSVYQNACVKKGEEYQIKDVGYKYWLAKKIDFKASRNGFHFLEANSYSVKHEKGVHDMTTLQADEAYNQGFRMAIKAYSGGQNLCYNPGIIKMPYVYDIDLKSSYVNAGHLIPDIKLDEAPLLDRTDLSLNEFKKLIPQLPNGIFTLGACDVDYRLPNNSKRPPVAAKAEIRKAMPLFVREKKREVLTLTSVIDLMYHKASIFIHRLVVPVQKILDGSIDCLYPSGKAQDWTLVKRNEAKQNYGKHSAKQEFYKQLGNDSYGKTAQGLQAKTKKKFGTNPFSKSTNPLVSMQYTAIAKYQVNFLMDLLDNLYSNNLIPSVTTDGFIWAGNQPLNKDKIIESIRKHAPRQWVNVNDKYFNGQFFEFKSKVDGDTKDFSKDTVLVNLRTRFNFTLDGRIRALAGIKNVSIESIYHDLLNDVVTIKTDQHRLTNLSDMKCGVDMKHRVDNKHLMSEWDQPEYQSLTFDFTSKPVSFHDNGDGLGYYNTEPFQTVEEAETFKNNIKPYSELFPLFNSEFAYAFLALDNHLVHTRSGYKIAWVKEDVPLKDRKYLDLLIYYQNTYKWKVLLRYLAKYEKKYDLKAIYNDVFSNQYSTFSGFKQAINRSKNKFINPLVVLKENWPEKLRKYETRC